ncbi:extensin-like [Vitis riparia]|uniref:extensin-like n=1 Tax=Vitis riparia TaxID=96939 RepID=UPI00155B3980|nr:extensin-like [Vitis riparia]
MARTRGAKSSSPSARKPTPREAPVQASTSEPPRPKVAPPPVKPTPKKRQAKPTLQTPPARRYLTRSGGRPLQKRARVESSEPIDLTGKSPVQSPVPSPEPTPKKPQASQPPSPEPQIQSATAPEAIIRRPMLTQPPIEGNLDCRARPFHSELCFDTAAFQLRPELEGSFQLLRRYRMEQLLTPHGILGAHHIAEALHIPYEPSHFDDFELGPVHLSWRWCISCLEELPEIHIC